MGDNEYQINTIASVSFNSLSFIGCTWLFYLYARSPPPYTVQFKMLVNLTLSDFLIAMTGFMTHFTAKTNRTCSLNIFLSLVGFWSSAFWAAAVAIFSYRKIANTHNFNSSSFYRSYVLIWAFACIGIPAIPVFEILDARYLAKEDFCVISFNTSPVALFFLSEGLPILAAIVVTTIAYIKQMRAIRKMPQVVLMMMNVKASKLLYYPIAQCFVFIPGLICQFVYLYAPYESMFFNIIRLYGFRLAGLVNSCVYGLQRMKVEKTEQSLLAASPMKGQGLLDSSFEVRTDEEGMM